MRTRHGSYPSPSDGITFSIRPSAAKRRRITTGSDLFDSLHDDVVSAILAAVAATASSPADVINTMLTCRRFCATITKPHILASASAGALAVRASSWCDGSSRYLKQCSDAGNVEASYILGMIRFYCLQNRAGGASLMAKAAMVSHAPALHSLAVIQFNGSGKSRKDKDLKAGVALCARAASLGHVDAMRELGHCLQDGYGVVKNVAKGRSLLLEANTREAAAAVAQSPKRFMEAALHLTAKGGAMACLQHHLHYYTVLGGKAKSASSLQPLQSYHQLQQQQQQQQRQERSVLLSPLHITVEEKEEEETSPPSAEPAAPPAAAAAAPATPPAAAGPATTSSLPLDCQSVYRLLQGGGCSLLSDFGCNVPPPKLHVANRFLVEWFKARPPPGGLRLCSHSNCGRPESRRHEFRRCSACGSVNYCSRACQALDWKIRHKCNCTPVANWEDRDENGGAAGAAAALDDGSDDGERVEEEDEEEGDDDDDEEQQQGFDEEES